MRTLLSASAVIPLLVAAFAPRAGAQQKHVEASFGWTKRAVSNTALDERIRDAATQYRSYAPIPRIAFFDIAYPKDSVEAVALSGYAVMIVTALVQDSTELPLSQLYLRTASGDHLIARYSAIASIMSDSVILGTFGRFRLDALYLVPISWRKESGDLLADFATHRSGFRLGQFDGRVPEQVGRLGLIREPTHLPSDTAVNFIVRREYPGLTAVLIPAP